MGSRLAVDVKETDEISHIRLSGVIDEDNDFSEISNRITKKVVAINTADVDRINSCGVRDWVTWHSELNKRGITIYLVECSPAIMTQVNLVNNFVGAGSILSFYAPYYCSACDADKMLLIEVDKALQNMPFKAPTCRCDQCDHALEFDDIESSYFAFLSTIPKRPANAEHLQALKRLSSSETKLRARTISVPIHTTPSTPSSSAPFTPTVPSGKELKGLLIDTIAPSMLGSKPTTPASNKLLYLIVALLVLAIGLLGYVVIRAM